MHAAVQVWKDQHGAIRIRKPGGGIIHFPAGEERANDFEGNGLHTGAIIERLFHEKTLLSRKDSTKTKERQEKREQSMTPMHEKTELELLEEQYEGALDDLMIMQKYGGQSVLMDANIRHKQAQVRELAQKITMLRTPTPDGGARHLEN